MLYFKGKPKKTCKLKKGFQAKVKKTEQRDTIKLANLMEEKEKVIGLGNDF